MNFEDLDVHLAPNQVAGHGTLLTTDEDIDGISKILKPLEKGSSEIAFYHHVTAATDDVSKAIYSHMPRYFGEVQLSDANHVVLENLVPGYKIPCILDVKIGTRQYTTAMSDKKVSNCIHKAMCSTSGEYGVRICGMKLWDEEEQDFININKQHGQNMSIRGFKLNLKKFVANPQVGKGILEFYLQQIQQLLAIFRVQTTYRFYSSSLLLVYDAFPESDERDLRMIDFAHSFELNEEGQALVSDRDDGHIDGGKTGLDVGYIRGLETLERILKEIQEETQ